MQSVQQTNCNISKDQRKELSEYGFSKVACKFNILIATVNDFDDRWIQWTSIILAEMLDQDMDGKI